MSPFESYAQATYLKHNKPKQYAEWVKKYGKPKDVPKKKKKMKK